MLCGPRRWLGAISTVCIQNSTALFNWAIPIPTNVWTRSQPTTFKPPTAFDPNTYSAELQAKLAHLQDLVQSNLAAAAQKQKFHYDKHSKMRTFLPEDPVWLSVPTSGKLHPRWEGKSTVVEVKIPINLQVSNGKSGTQTVFNITLYHRLTSHYQHTYKDILHAGTPSSYTPCYWLWFWIISLPTA